MMRKNSYINTVKNFGDAITDVQEASGYDWVYSHKMRNFKIYTYYIPVNNGPIQYNLGARDLLVYIAHKIEIKHCPRTIKSPQLPYETIIFFLNIMDGHMYQKISGCVLQSVVYIMIILVGSYFTSF